MRRYLIPLLCALSLAGMLAAAGQAVKGGPLNFKVTLIQEETIRHPIHRRATPATPSRPRFA